MFPGTMSPFGLRRDQVTAMTIEGESLSSVEQMLDDTRLPADQKDALWLLAWSLGQRLAERDGTAVPDAPWRAGPALRPLPGGE